MHLLIPVTRKEIKEGDTLRLITKACRLVSEAGWTCSVSTCIENRRQLRQMGLSQMGGAILSTDCVDLSSYLKLVLHVRTGSSFQSSQCLCCNGLAHLYVGFRRAAGSSAAAPNRPRSDDSVLHETPETHHLSVSVNHHHQSLNREGRWGATDGFATSFLHFSLFSTAL